MLAVIPYTTFPKIDLGPLDLRTFGLFVALGVLVGAWLAARYVERFGVSRDETYRVATWMVLAGIVGARLTWAATHTESIDNPVDVIAIWEGGIQFSGGFIAALLVGLPFFKRWSRLQRWRVLDGFSFGLAIGLALGRVGCYSVGEHFGRTSDFFLATRYDGGDVREPALGSVPLAVGTTFHNTALYELLLLLALFAGMGLVIWRAHRRGREVRPGWLVGSFIGYYGVARLLTDTLRVNDDRVLHMTGAQWMAVIMIPAAAWILLRVRPGLATLAAQEASSGEAESAAVGGAAAADGVDAEPAAADGVAAKDDAAASASADSSDEEKTGDDAGAAEPEPAEPVTAEPDAAVDGAPGEGGPEPVTAGSDAGASADADVDAAPREGEPAAAKPDAVAAEATGADQRP